MSNETLQSKTVKTRKPHRCIFVGGQFRLERGVFIGLAYTMARFSPHGAIPSVKPRGRMTETMISAPAITLCLKESETLSQHNRSHSPTLGPGGER
jgi:hypothetical protein